MTRRDDGLARFRDMPTSIKVWYFVCGGFWLFVALKLIKWLWYAA